MRIAESAAGTAGAAVSAVSLPVSLTVYTSTSSPLSKSFSLCGDRIEKTAAAHMTAGSARLVEVPFSALGDLFDSLGPDEATGYGLFDAEHTRIAVAKKARPPSLLARTKEHCHYRARPGVLMLDHDPHPRGASMRPDELLATIADIVPGLADAAVLTRASVSAGVRIAGHDASPPAGGYHIYIPVADASDISRFGAALFRRLWLAGHGYIALARTGAMLVRTCIDAAVFAAERLDFTGRPVIGDGLEWAPPAAEYRHGGYLDTAALPDLSDAENAEYDALVAAAKAAAKPDADKHHRAWLDAHGASMRAAGVPEDRIAARLASMRAGATVDVHADWPLCFASAKLGIVTAGQVLADLKRFDGETLADPVEGPRRGTSTARFYANLPDGRPVINSMAHGGTLYFLTAAPADAAPANTVAGLRILGGIDASHDEGYWESVLSEEQPDRANACKNNFKPSLPSLPSFPVQIQTLQSVTEKNHSVTSVTSVTVDAPELEDLDDKGKPILIESAAAARLVGCLKTFFSFSRSSASWYAFTGTHWESIPAGLVDDAVVPLLYAGAPHGFKARTLTAITSLLSKGLLPLPEKARDTRLIPFANGLLDPDTRTLTPITPDNALTWSLPYAYDPAADCPTIRAWLRNAVTAECPEEGDNPDDLVQFLRAWLAALLTGRADLQRFLHLLGPGATGKSTFIRLAEALVGVRNATITDMRNLETNRFETAALHGKRLVAVTDSGKYGGSIDVFKAMTGQDPLRLERKHQQQGGTFVFDGLVLIASNEPLQFTDYTGAVERRRMTIEFSRRITADERAAWDAQGGEAMVLHREIPGVVNWCLALSREDVTRIIKDQPPQMARLNRETMQHSNPIADWLLQCVVPDPNRALTIGGFSEVTVSERTGECSTESRKLIEQADDRAYPNYRRWCLEVHRSPVSARRFSGLVMDIAKTLGADVFKGKSSIGAYIKGLRLREATDPENIGWQANDGSSDGSFPAVTQVTDKNTLRHSKNSMESKPDDGSDGSDGKSPQTFLQRVSESEKRDGVQPPVAATVQKILSAAPSGMLRDDLAKAVSRSHPTAGAMVDATINHLLLSGRIAPTNGRIVLPRQGGSA